MVLAKGRGFDRAEVSLWDRLRAGEPWLFLAAALISVPLVLSMSAYSRRTFTGSYRNSVACYGRISALANLPEVEAKADGFAVYESVQGYRTSAFRTGAELGMRPGEVSEALADRAASFSRAFALLQRQQRRQEMEAEIARTLRCVHPPADPANA
jgi:hypothetical protein